MKRLILLSVMCLVAIASNAQGISGRVIDEQSQPMPFANVVLLNRTDSVFIVGAVTKDDGTFTIETERQDGKCQTNVRKIFRLSETIFAILQPKW